jgi:ankyrin repeat protein
VISPASSSLLMFYRTEIMYVTLPFLRSRTPLHLSVHSGHLQICRLLLQSSADIEAKDRT